MYCPNCGSEIKENSTFCTNCGKAVSTTECRSAEHDYNHAAEPTGASAGYPVPPTQSANGDCMEPMTVKDYIGMMLLMLIPVANIVLLFVWAFGGPTNRNKRNYCRAAAGRHRAGYLRGDRGDRRAVRGGRCRQSGRRLGRRVLFLSTYSRVFRQNSTRREKISRRVLWLSSKGVTAACQARTEGTDAAGSRRKRTIFRLSPCVRYRAAKTEWPAPYTTAFR